MNKTTPETACREEPRTLCAPRGCAEKQVWIVNRERIVILLPKCLFQCHACENQVKAAVVAKPVEECDLEPQKVGFWFFL